MDKRDFIYSQLSYEKLEDLMHRKCETNSLDYKEVVDISEPSGIVELSKDVMAMSNSEGGHIVIGVKDGIFAPVGVAAQHAEQFKDSITLNNKLRRYVGPSVAVHCNKHNFIIENSQLTLIVIYVAASYKPVMAADNGVYEHPKGSGKQKWVFRKGDIFIRKSDASVKAESPDDLPEAFSTRRSDRAGTRSRVAGGRLIPTKLNAGFRNPYDFAHVATREVFKGRREEIEQLLDNIASGAHTAVYGLQRMGKTSLVEHAIKHEMARRSELNKKVNYVKIDFQQTNYSRYIDVFDLFLKSIGGLYKSDLAQARAAQILAGFAKEAADPSIGDRKQLFEPFAMALRELISISAGKKVVLFLDEFSEWCRVVEMNQAVRTTNRRRGKLQPYESLVDVELMQLFSSLMRDDSFRDRLVFIFAIRPFMAEYDNKRNLQILKLAESITLYYLDRESARALMTEPIQKAIPIDDDSVQYLYNITAGHPYLIQSILKRIVDKVSRKGILRIDEDAIRSEESRMITEGPAFEAAFRVLDSDYSVEVVVSEEQSSLGRGVLSLVAKMGDEESEGWVKYVAIRQEMERLRCKKALTDQLLDQLVKAKILEETQLGDQLCFRMTVPLLRRRYIEQNYYLKYFSNLLGR